MSWSPIPRGPDWSGTPYQVLDESLGAAVLSLAAAGLTASGSEGGFSSILAGAALLGVAAVSPYSCFASCPSSTPG
ncbi:MAG: hypothetical protein ACRDV9_12145 [Acidimicrobiia bacterium]